VNEPSFPLLQNYDGVCSSMHDLDLYLYIYLAGVGGYILAFVFLLAFRLFTA
jgi:hypothetical protein